MFHGYEANCQKFKTTTYSTTTTLATTMATTAWEENVKQD